MSYSTGNESQVFKLQKVSQSKTFEKWSGIFFTGWMPFQSLNWKSQNLRVMVVWQ